MTPDAAGTEPKVALAPVPAEDASEAVAAVEARGAAGAPVENGGPQLSSAASESTNVWNDEAAENAFLAEARERGEPVTPVRAKAKLEGAPETEAKNLPPLDELVQRLSPEVRETLDDLFRAKFTTVRRLPSKALKA